MVSLCFLFALCGCAYTVYSNQYPHLKTIQLLTLDNKSTQYGIEQDLLNSLATSFLKERRLKIVTVNPDCHIEGKILDYSNKIYSYDNANNVKEYQVKLLLEIHFIDHTTNTILWENNQLLLSKVYSVEVTPNKPNSEEAAREEIYQDLYKEIMKNTLESW